MIHSRPGYAPRRSDQEIAKLNDDMIPAINRKTPEQQKAEGPQKLDLSHRKLKKPPESAPAAVPADVLKAAERAAGPELILNPEPSVTPKVLEPGK
jgi:hypothetical protein